MSFISDALNESKKLDSQEMQSQMKRHDKKSKMPSTLKESKHRRLKEGYDEPIVISKDLTGYIATPKSNYDSRIRNEREITKLYDFDSPQEIIDYFVKYGWANGPEDFIVLTENLKLKESDMKTSKYAKELIGGLENLDESKKDEIIDDFEKNEKSKVCESEEPKNQKWVDLEAYMNNDSLDESLNEAKEDDALDKLNAMLIEEEPGLFGDL